MMNRRNMLLAGAGAAALAAGLFWRNRGGTEAAAETFAVNKTDAEWRAQLGDAAYRVLRREATEPRYSSSLLKEKRAGTFHCKGCDLALYSSKAKYDSGTGWPSFWQALPGAVATRADFSLLMERTEVHCRRCGGHLGHVFDDGPPPTGKRHCLNGLALTFTPASA